MHQRCLVKFIGMAPLDLITQPPLQIINTYVFKCSMSKKDVKAHSIIIIIIIVYWTSVLDMNGEEMCSFTKEQQTILRILSRLCELSGELIVCLGQTEIHM